MGLDYLKALRYAQLAEIPQKVELRHSLSGLASLIRAAGGKYVATIYGRELATFVNAYVGEKVMYGYIALFGKEIVVALRCTETFLEAVHDVAFVSIPNPNKGCRGWVASGFSSVYNSLTANDRPLLEALSRYASQYDTYEITVVGHSLGGPLATLLAEAVVKQISPPDQVSVWTYGSPRVGGMVFAIEYGRLVPNTNRITIDGDLVQYVPIIPAYYHVDTHYALTPPPNTINPGWLCRHHISSYIWLLATLGGKEGVIPDKGCEAKGFWGSIWARIRGK